jgi:hypothetical protein
MNSGMTSDGLKIVPQCLEEGQHQRRLCRFFRQQQLAMLSSPLFSSTTSFVARSIPVPPVVRGGSVIGCSVVQSGFRNMNDL